MRDPEVDVQKVFGAARENFVPTQHFQCDDYVRAVGVNQRAVALSQLCRDVRLMLMRQHPGSRGFWAARVGLLACHGNTFSAIWH